MSNCMKLDQDDLEKIQSQMKDLVIKNENDGKLTAPQTFFGMLLNCLHVIMEVEGTENGLEILLKTINQFLDQTGKKVSIAYAIRTTAPEVPVDDQRTD